MKKVFVPALLAAVSTLHAEPAVQAEETRPRQKIDVSQFPQQAKMMDDVVVPVPSEIFGVLDKLQKPRWAAVQRRGMASIKPTGDQAQIALLLGTVIAEGFIAVEAEDTEEVKNIGNSVLTLSRALGVEKQVKERAKSITDASEKKDWQSVRRELDKTLDNVRDAMVALDNAQISQLVSLGGWLRGTEALCKVVSDGFTKDGAELLHQPMLLDYFERRLAGMGKKIKANTVVTRVQKGILEIRPLVGLEDGTQISEKSVKDIGKIAEDLVKTISSKAP
jgi:RNA binding exosome subunit